MIEAVIFDCDGVLVDSEVLALEVELGSLAEIGLDYSRADFVAQFTGRSNEAFFALLEEDSLARRGRGLPDGFREACHAKYRTAYQRLVEVPGARAAVAGVVLPKAVASSSTRAALGEKLRLTQLWELFAPHVYSADHVVHAKPAPDLFLHAADALRIAPCRLPRARRQHQRCDGGARGRNAGVGLFGRRPHGRRTRRASADGRRREAHSQIGPRRPKRSQSL
jgi:beta-phosphoglucomutase-like phosphatase (HAD superfamily)